MEERIGLHTITVSASTQQCQCTFMKKRSHAFGSLHIFIIILQRLTDFFLNGKYPAAYLHKDLEAYLQGILTNIKRQKRRPGSL